MKKKDLLIMCQFFYPEYVSSATLPFDTAKALADKGYSIGVLCGYPKEYTEEHKIPRREIFEGIEIKRIKYIQTGRKGFLGRLINYFSFTISTWLNLREARKYKAVMVYSNPPILPQLAVTAKKRYGNKMIFVSYDVYPEIALQSGALGEGSMITKMFTRINRQLFEASDCVVALSDDMKQYLENNRPISSECRVVKIPNWFEDHGESPKRDIAYHPLFSHIEKDDFVVSYLGNLGTCQDETTILEAIRILKDDPKIKFVFAGHGNKMAELKRVIEQESLTNVACFDFLKGEDYRVALSVSDCYIVSLIDGLLGLCSPSKAYGYMMQGRPVACIMDPQSELARDLEDRRAGKCFACGDGSGLAEFFIHLRQNPKICREMGQRCREVYLEKYEKERCLEKYVQLVDELLRPQERKEP